MPKILIIEDADDLRNDMIEMLKLEGYDTWGAPNGIVGLEIAQEQKPDMIVCDIMMPKLDGYGVLHELRQNPETAVIPFMFLTAKTDREDVQYGMTLGADDYLTKPFLIGELLARIDSRLERRAELTKKAEDKITEIINNITYALPHEFRSPLNTIIGFSEMLIFECQSLKPDQVAEWASFINQGAMRLFHLVENYLLFVRAETMANNPEWQQRLKTVRTENPQFIIQMQVTHLAQQADRESDIVFEMGNVPAVQIEEDDYIKIIDVLLDNAFKFSERQTPIRITLDAEDGMARLGIHDQGDGMTAEQLAAVNAFMQFERREREQQGVGLGLIIARRLAELYRGNLKIDSTYRQSTDVYACIPLAP